MAGQRLMVGFDGTIFNSDLESLIKDLKVSGIILFSQNIENPDQLTTLCKSIQSYALVCGQPPMFIAIDQEGGTVARLRKPHFKEFPSVTALKNESDAKAFSRDMATELSKLGINMNMAPVMDVAPTDIASIMKKRIFGNDPKQVSKMGRTIIKHHQKQNIMAVAKHFPGIGRTTTDSHLELPELAVTENDLDSFDLIPFKAAVESRVSGIMLSHIRYTDIDSVWPASLSPEIARNLLRNRMGFNGIVMTDDLDMGAIKNHYDIQTVIRQVLAAEIDLALICHKGPNIEIAFKEMKKNISEDRKLKEKNNESLKRIMACKKIFLKDAAPVF
ncbi:MAG: beta-N-acetylhexosaminidase [Desulfobacteraceae bacterium]|nr:beta-N-acetylhexosaminidase [Desulfobacteraceae bacterium]MBC2758000.1 beta-N-acetylhexosaminidase [Desulfobacteraceae bacterium]